MNEEEWLTATDPAPMLEFLRGKASSRKLQLIVLECCRALGPVWGNETTRRMLAVSEQMIEGTAADELVASLSFETRDVTRITRNQVVNIAHQYLLSDVSVGMARFALEGSGFALSESPDNPPPLDAVAVWQVSIVQDIFGPLPFRQVAFNPAWRTSTVLALAKGIYQDRSFDRLPILADALMDAGCDSDDILNHLRGGGEHCRGCWALDLVLGKE